VEGVVAVELEAVDGSETHGRPVHLGDRNGPVEGDDR